MRKARDLGGMSARKKLKSSAGASSNKEPTGHWNLTTIAHNIADPVWETMAHPGATFRSYAICWKGVVRPYDECEFSIHRIVSRRRGHREIVGGIRTSHDKPRSKGGENPVPRFAEGAFVVERSGDSGADDDSVLGCVMGLHDSEQGDAMICEEHEGVLEESELRLLPKCVTHGQRLTLEDDDGSGRTQSLVTQEGDVELTNAFREPGRDLVACLFRRQAPT